MKRKVKTNRASRKMTEAEYATLTKGTRVMDRYGMIHRVERRTPSGLVLCLRSLVVLKYSKAEIIDQFTAIDSH